MEAEASPPPASRPAAGCLELALQGPDLSHAMQGLVARELGDQRVSPSLPKVGSQKKRWWATRRYRRLPGRRLPAYPSAWVPFEPDDRRACVVSAI